MSELGDRFDQATAITEMMNDAAVSKQLKSGKAKQVRNPDGSWPQPFCRICDDEIGEARLNAVGADTCIECATRAEQKAKTR